MAHLRPIFCGNFEYDAAPREIERLFERYGTLDRVDMKTGFAFVYMKDSRDGDDAIRALDGREFGYRRRRLRVEWAKGDGEVRRREETRKKEVKPATTLFVVNFDVDRVRERDLERHFEPYGRLKRVQIKRNYAFVQYETIDQAEEALKATHGTRLHGDNRVLSVEYVAREADGRGNERDGGGYGGSDRGGYGSRERDRARSRSRSPPYRGRVRSRSPSYGRASPVRSRRGRDSRSPVMGRDSRSPIRGRDSRSPDRGRDSRSPVRGRDSRSPVKGYSRSPVKECSRSVSRDRSLSR